MLANHFTIDENTSVSAFLKGLNEKKNMHYIILDTEPKSLIDTKTISLKLHNQDEKLHSLKKPLPWTKEESEEKLIEFLINSGESIIESPTGYFDFLNALEYLKKNEFKFKQNKIYEIVRKEIYALNPQDKISTAKNLFLKNKVSILPVIENMEVVGELRIQDLLNADLFNKESSNKNFYDEGHKDSLFNMEISNLMNSKPLTIGDIENVEDALNLMINKKLPSLIVTKNSQIYSILNFKDLFKLYKKEVEKPKYSIEILGEDNLFDDEIKMVKGFAFKTMEKLKKTNFNLLKISFKHHGQKDSSHQRKIEIKATLSSDSNSLNYSKDVQTQNSNKEYDSKIKGAWNITKTAQEALKILENKVHELKN